MIEIQNNGIAVIDNAFSPEYCAKVISFFKWSQNNNQTWDRSHEAPELIKKDESCSIDNHSQIYGSEHSPLVGEFNQIFFNQQ